LYDTFNSNHDRGPESEVIRFLQRHDIPFHYLRTTENKREEEILKLVQNTDFLVLARYMQVINILEFMLSTIPISF
jgi:formyltetrahydrofolate deformylase